MSLKVMMEDLLQSVSGGLAIMVMGYDGIPVTEVVLESTSCDVHLLSAGYAAIFKQIRHSVELVKAGEMEEVLITSSLARAVMRRMSDDLFIILILSHEGNVGKARYMLRLQTSQLAKEFE